MVPVVGQAGVEGHHDREHGNGAYRPGRPDPPYQDGNRPDRVAGTHGDNKPTGCAAGSVQGMP